MKSLTWTRKKIFYNSNISVSKCLESAYISTFCSWKPLLGQDDPPNFNRFNIPRYPQRCFSPYQSVDASFLIGKWSTDVLRLAALATEPGNNNWCLAIPSPWCRLGRDYHVRFAPDQQRFECGYDPDPWDWPWPSCMEFIWIHGLWSSHHHERSLKFKNHRMSPLGRWTL